MKKVSSPAFQFVAHAWDAIPGNSWHRINSGMYSALNNAIRSGMKFDPQDIVQMGEQFDAGYWITNGGEGLYELACGSQRGSGNTSAAIAMETWMGRPAYLWAERSKTPERLYVGARFTWRGHLVTVTSMGAESLVACTYKDERDSNEENVLGAVAYVFGSQRRIEALAKTEADQIMVRYSAKLPNGDQSRSVAKRFTVKHAELTAERKAYEARRKKYEALFAAAQTFDELDAATKAAQAEGRAAFRHFDIEILRESASASRQRIKEAMSAAEQHAWQLKHDQQQAADLARWVNGEEIARHFSQVRLRVRDGWVETSTGQRATVKGARAGLAFIRKHQAKGWHRNGETFDVDAFPIERIGGDGVQVGCTLVPMSEINRIAPLLKA
jgi:hypothetical protein